MPINLFTTLTDAYRFLWQNPRDLFSYAFLPVLIVSFVQILGLWATGSWQLYFEPVPLPVPGETPTTVDTALAEIDPVAVGASMANGIASFAAYVMFAVAWIRRFLIGPEGATVGAAMRWGPRHWRFVSRFVALVVLLLVFGLLITVPINMLAASNPALEIFARASLVIAMLLIASRLFLVLPAAAVDDPLGFRDAAILTRGKSWYMLGIYLFSLVPALFALIILAQVMSGVIAPMIGPSLSFLLVAILIQQAIMFVAIACQVTALAVAYRLLRASTQTPTSV